MFTRTASLLATGVMAQMPPTTPHVNPPHINANFAQGIGKGLSNFFAALPHVSGVDGDPISHLEKLKGQYHIPDTDENFKKVLENLKEPKPTVLSSQYPSMVVPMLDGKATSWKPVGASDNWMKELYGHSAPDSVGDVFYDVAHPVEWGAALGHDVYDDVKHFRIWHLLRILVFLFMIYLVVGSIVRFRCYGARGLQMIPHIEVWTGMFLNLQAGALLVSQKLGMKEELQQRISPKVEYEDFGL